MKKLRRLIPLCWILPILSLSCEIEEDFGAPDTSAHFGTSLYSPIGYIQKIYSYEAGNEIIVASERSITAVNVATKKVREFSNVIAYFYSSWIEGENLYYTDDSGRLSSINIVTGNTTMFSVDSVSIPYNASPFTQDFVAFENWGRIDDSYNPSLHLFEFETQKETLITYGSPITFSPDGTQLLLTKYYQYNSTSYYVYDIPTKTISPLDIDDPEPYGYKIVRWSKDGIIFFSSDYDYSTVIAHNATKHQEIGRWESVVAPDQDSVSPHGDKLITAKAICGDPYVSFICGYPKQSYAIVDVGQNTETEIAFGGNLYMVNPVFLHDGNTIAYIQGNTIYLADTTD